MNASQLKQALHRGQRVYGTMITAFAPRWVEYLKNSGVDFVFIDTEHIPLDRSQVSWMCKCFTGADISPIVRIPSPDPFEACKALDGGAVGVVAPYVETLEQAQALRGAVYYRPLKGKKLAAVLDGSVKLSQKESEYLEAYNQDRIMIINCESTEGITNLNQLLSVPGVDAVFIGPHDLSVNLGLPEQYESPLFLDKVDEIIHICTAKGISVGNHFSADLEKQIRWAKSGMNIILWNFDICRFTQAIQCDFDRVRKALDDSSSTMHEGPSLKDI